MKMIRTSREPPPTLVVEGVLGDDDGDDAYNAGKEALISSGNAATLPLPLPKSLPAKQAGLQKQKVTKKTPEQLSWQRALVLRANRWKRATLTI
jgi:hypothetical protein